MGATYFLDIYELVYFYFSFSNDSMKKQDAYTIDKYNKKIPVANFEWPYMVKEVKEENLFRAMNAWGIDYELIQLAKKKGMKKLKLQDFKNKLNYYITIEKFEQEAKFLNYGYGLQQYCSLDNFKIIPQ